MSDDTEDSIRYPLFAGVAVANPTAQTVLSYDSIKSAIDSVVSKGSQEPPAMIVSSAAYTMLMNEYNMTMERYDIKRKQQLIKDLLNGKEDK